LDSATRSGGSICGTRWHEVVCRVLWLVSCVLV
jgi:hypothetical protein